MIKQLELVLLPEEAADEATVLESAAKALHLPSNRVNAVRLLKRSIDARSKQVRIRLLLEIFTDDSEVPQKESTSQFNFENDVSGKKSVLIIGCGPAGMFAALRLIELGYKPVIIERGKTVRDRRRDLARINKEGLVNPESNYCFGEGGAGTYSDGKLYTRSGKRGDINRILSIFVHHGADPVIMIDAHPHIGTNKLPNVVESIRQTILSSGAEIHFETKMTDLILNNNQVQGIITTNTITGEEKEFKSEKIILATGHSARDVFEILERRNVRLEKKDFALGVRIEHPQNIIDKIQYHCEERSPYLPPASYSLSAQVNGRGVYSFCMCPGGIIAPAATNPDEIVVNGWSPSKRNNPWANSGMIVSVGEKDFIPFADSGELRAMRFQESIEKKSFITGGGRLVAPAQRMIDFTEDKISSSLPPCSYLPGIRSVSLREILPMEIHTALKEGLTSFGKKMKGYFTNEAVLVATESRTSSPVRIPREQDSLLHPEINGLYPCAEGAGYAGGIVSAAIDGERCAEAAVKSFH